MLCGHAPHPLESVLAKAFHIDREVAPQLAQQRTRDLFPVLGAVIPRCIDELHTYRGRQGADVALLTRRQALLITREPRRAGPGAVRGGGSPRLR
ncbi:MAG TPA: hypothetical protein VMK13_13630 [Streptosporangiaceae bacterium]|nr:hypothetical protein [Streptosporangiaceae bacterium]